MTEPLRLRARPSTRVFGGYAVFVGLLLLARGLADEEDRVFIALGLLWLVSGAWWALGSVAVDERGLSHSRLIVLPCFVPREQVVAVDVLPRLGGFMGWARVAVLTETSRIELTLLGAHTTAAGQTWLDEQAAVVRDRLGVPDTTAAGATELHAPRPVDVFRWVVPLSLLGFALGASLGATTHEPEPGSSVTCSTSSETAEPKVVCRQDGPSRERVLGAGVVGTVVVGGGAALVPLLRRRSRVEAEA